jgi:DNA-binding IclR family transcriptional regulator
VSDSETNSPYKVQVLDRTLSILNALASAGRDASLVELAGMVKLHKSTVHRLTMILENHRMVERNPQTGRYHLGPRLFELGSIAVESFNVRDRARRHLERLVYEVEETVHLCVLDGGQVLYLEKIEPARGVRNSCYVGRRNPAHCTAVGKAILARLADAEVDEIVDRHGLARRTANTITMPIELKAELSVIRARGYAVDDEEVEDGVRCVGAAVLDQRGAPLAAISVSGPASRINTEKLPVIAACVCRAAAELSRECGHRGEAEAERAAYDPVRSDAARAPR